MIRLGIIGTGNMANNHAMNFQAIHGVKLTACCDVAGERAQTFADKYGIPKVYTDYREMLATEKLDAVANVTPDVMHAKVALAIIAHGLHIMSEKPIATSLADARAMAKAADKAGIMNMVNYSYRNSSALQKAAEVIRQGKIGRVIHVESSYLQGWLTPGGWKNKPSAMWRLSTAHGSAGDLGDLGCHIYDMTALLCGDIAEINCRLQTFDKGVEGNTLGEYVLDANDSFVSTVTFANGGLGTIHSSRWATGHANSLRVRVFGDAGAIEIDLDRSYDEYLICAGAKAIAARSWTNVKCKPTPTNYQRFIRAIKTGKNDTCDFANGVKVQAYLHYSVESDKTRAPMKVIF